jgi:hypothetical protein
VEVYQKSRLQATTYTSGVKQQASSIIERYSADESEFKSPKAGGYKSGFV